MSRSWNRMVMMACFFLVTITCIAMAGSPPAPAGKTPAITMTITGQIVKDNQNYIIRGKVPAELFTILNPNPGILDKLADSGETVKVEAVSVMGDNIEIKTIDGTPYSEPK